MRHPDHLPDPNILRPGLERSISLTEALVYGLGIIFGAGIYALIGEAVGIAGNSVWLSFVLAAFVASFTALSYCELSSMFPKSAAEYIYVKNAFKSSMLGFLTGWISLFVAMVAVSAVAIGFGGYFSAIFGVPIVLSAVSIIALLSIVNFLGVKESARLNLVFTVVAIGGLILIILMGLPFLGSVNYFETVVPNATPLEAMNNVAIAAALIFFAYIGFEDIANISEETVNARKAIPKAILITLVVSTVLYILVSVSVVSIVPWQELSQSTAPISLVAGKVFGPTASTVFSFIALFATASTVLIILIAVSRTLYGMSNDHSLPGIISRVHSKAKTPFVSIALTSIAAMLFVLSGSLKQIAFITNFGIFALFFIVNLAAVVLRFTKPDEKRVFRVPYSVGKMPIIPLFGALASLFMLTRVVLAEPDSAIIGTIVILAGIPLYFLIKRIK